MPKLTESEWPVPIPPDTESTLSGSDLPDPQRRKLLQALTLLLGTGTLAGLGGFTAPIPWLREAQADEPGGNLLDDAGRATLALVCEHIIPRTDTPGAIDAGVPEFVLAQLAACYPEAYQQGLKHLLATLDAQAEQRHRQPFRDCPPANQLALLQDLEAARDGFDGSQRGDFKQLKSLVMFGFFTSEPGCTLLLAWDPVPGGFRGSMPFSEIGRAWAPGGIY